MFLVEVVSEEATDLHNEVDVLFESVSVLSTSDMETDFGAHSDVDVDVELTIQSTWPTPVESMIPSTLATTAESTIHVITSLSHHKNTMATVPGSIGLPLVSDKSYTFYKDPVKFAEQNFEYYRSRTFCARFLNTPTIFIGSNALLHEVLQEKQQYMELGYKSFLEGIYGDNILFTEGEVAESLRQALSFTLDHIEFYKDIVQRYGMNFMHIPVIPHCIYKLFKQITTEICLSLFLGLDFTQERDAAETIVSLTTEHWHGIISFPVSFKLPMMSASSYKKALAAKVKLLEVIRVRRSDSKSSFFEKLHSAMSSEQISDDRIVNNHLLLFTSALVPKAIASILTSLTLELGKEDKLQVQKEVCSNSHLLDTYIMETVRLYPPFFAGRRIIKDKFDAGGYHFPEGYAVMYLTYATHRDPATFDRPDHFLPERWKDGSAIDKSGLFSFGSGSRSCLGQTLVVDIIKITTEILFSQCRVTIPDRQNLSHKWLPVSRPKCDVQVKFDRRQPQ
ncbi:hypothetical protein ScPMuIL_007156 [Solemya velum]